MNSMKRRGVTLAIAMLAVAFAAALAVAATKGPKTEPVQATFTAHRTAAKAKTCAGEDGTYSKTRERYEGTVTGDPRLTGKLVVTTHSLVNQGTGLGSSRGDVRILDATTGHQKAHAKFEAVVTGGSVLNGFLTGHVRSQGGEPPRRDGRLLANFRAEGNAQGAVTGVLGTGTSENSAVVQSGGCGKPEPAKAHGKKPANAHGKKPAKPHGKGKAKATH